MKLIEILKKIFIGAKRLTDCIVELQDLKKDDLFIYNNSMYKKHVYDRSTKKYLCINVKTFDIKTLSGQTIVTTL